MNRIINILLVEDDNLDVIDFRRTLDKTGLIYRMKVAKNGEEALEMLEQKEHELFVGLPDVIILDINMPRMNGIEFLQIFRKNDAWSSVKVFVLTTSGESEDKKAVSDLGVSGYIIKPFKTNNPGSIDAFNLMIDLMNM